MSAEKDDKKAAKVAAAGADAIALMLADLTAADSLQLLDATDSSASAKVRGSLDVDQVRAKGLEEYLLEHYGDVVDRKFIVRIRRRATGQYGKQCTITIAGDPGRASRSTTAASSSAASPAAGGSVLEKVLLTVAVPVATAFATLLAKKMVEDKPNPLDDVVKLKQLVGGGGGADVAATLTLVENARNAGIELGKQLAAAGDKGDWTDLVREFAPPLISTIQSESARMRRTTSPAIAPASHRGAGGAQASGTKPATPEPQSAAPAGEASATPPALEIPEGFGFVKRVLPRVPDLLKLAKADRDPALYADMLLEQLDLAGEQQLLNELEVTTRRDDFVDVALELITKASGNLELQLDAHQAWLRTFLEHAKESLAGNDDGTEVING